MVKKPLQLFRPMIGAIHTIETGTVELPQLAVSLERNALRRLRFLARWYVLNRYPMGFEGNPTRVHFGSQTAAPRPSARPRFARSSNHSGCYDRQDRPLTVDLG